MPFYDTKLHCFYINKNVKKFYNNRLPKSVFLLTERDVCESDLSHSHSIVHVKKDIFCIYEYSERPEQPALTLSVLVLSTI